MSNRQAHRNIRLIARSWASQLERELFPHQESEEEQESFTSEGRKRAEKVLCEMLRAVCGAITHDVEKLTKELTGLAKELRASQKQVHRGET